MCGIAGIFDINNRVDTVTLKRMTDAIAHRGPDGEGHWISSDGKIGLGHRRLSIIDLSHEADQPMHYMERYTIVFNGEIYNYIELREDLKKDGYLFHTSSDTEVLMAMYDKYKENCLKYLDGMFAFVIYDKQKHMIFGARDRFGEKPLFYYFKKGKKFVFGSEMKCLWAADIKKEYNPVLIMNYLANGYLTNPSDNSQTFFNDCKRLEHSCYFTLDTKDPNLKISRYYSIKIHTENTVNEKDVVNKFNDLFFTSVKRRLRSDVPVGSSLSGGLDSSLVVCVINELKKGTHQKQETFSAVFPGFVRDERKYMDKVISIANVHPNFVTPTAEGLASEFEKLCWHQEEPFGTASIYLQYCVMRLAKEKNVTVLLDGQGADEILAGYSDYYKTYFRELRSKNQYELATYEIKKMNEILGKNAPVLDTTVGLKAFIKEMAIKYAKQLLNKSRIDKIKKQGIFNTDFLQEHRQDLFADERMGSNLNDDLVASTMNFGLQSLLRFADRNSMAHSREVRLPFLYHELVEFLLNIPSSYKIKDGWTKYIMRIAFESILPSEITWRKDKIAYAAPQDEWMKTGLMKEMSDSVAIILRNDRILNKNMNLSNNWRVLSLFNVVEK